MKQIKSPNIELEPIEKMIDAGRFNQAMEIIINGIHYTLYAGRSDTISVYEKTGYIHILNINRKLNYIGLQIFDTNNPEYEPDEVFLKYNDAEDILQLDDEIEMINDLMNYIY